MRRTAVVLLTLLTLSLGLASCGPDQDAPVSEFSADDRDDAKKEARKAVEGVFTGEESDCIIDKVFARDDLTTRQILDYAKKPGTGGPAERAYVEEVPKCVDPDTEIENPAPMTDAVRDGFVKGATGDGSLDEQQATCLLDALTASGFTARDLTLAGYFPEKQQEITDKVGEVAGGCVGDNP